MNKQERKLKGYFKWVKRLDNIGLSKEHPYSHIYKTTGKPCSCVMCSPGKEIKCGKEKNKAFERYYSFI